MDQLEAPEDSYPVIAFHQYEADEPDDLLLLFSAPASAIWAWAGIPRKGWRVRMLYQRWITEARKQEITGFWNQASQRRDNQPKKYLVGPTALTVAIAGDPIIDAGRIHLSYSPPFSPADDDLVKLTQVATRVLNMMQNRLDQDERTTLYELAQFDASKDYDFGHNYVLESLAQIQDIVLDAAGFVQANELGDADIMELVESLEALSRPALVVDGQHRLYGAAHSSAEIWLPVVAMPNSPWMEQIYQFVVINEKAQRVETSLLTDIFGSSLTPSEQKIIRLQLDRSGARVEERIAAVIAARDASSPFAGLVKIKLSGEPPGDAPGIIPELTIRQLIEGGRGSRGWRTDDVFYNTFVAQTYQERADWDSWTEGAWRVYWFAFWDEVKKFYNEQTVADPLWSATQQSNLTKAVALRLLQKLFIEKCIHRVETVQETRSTLVDVLGEERADGAIRQKIAEVSLPASLDEFRSLVRSWFLEKGIPVRVFTKPWVSSLDDAEGQARLYDELEDAFDRSQKGLLYRAENKFVFAVGQ